MGKKSPSPPDPAAQAAAQGAANKEASYWNAVLNNMNQYTPYGSIEYTQTGDGTYDPNKPPQFTSTVTLSPEQQQILESQNRQGIAMNELGEQQIGRISQSVANPYSFDNIQNALPTYGSIQDMSNQYTEALMSRLNPQFQRDEEALRTRLINQGIGQGSEAYDREMERFGQNQNDARIQALLAGQQYGATDMNSLMGLRNQEINEYNTQRNAPLNEYIGLTSGTQITNPQFQSANYQGIQPFDIAGAMRNDYSNRQAAANNQGSAMTSLFGLGGSALGSAGMLGGLGATGGGFLGSALGGLFALSDIRAKENITPYGLENGFKTYKFSYRGDDKQYIGVMAHEVQDVMPEAVKEVNGYLTVNYDAIGVEMREVH